MGVEVIRADLLFALRVGIDHGEGELARIRSLLPSLDGGGIGDLVGLAFGDAEAAANAVLGSDLDAELQGLIFGADGRFDASFDDLRGSGEFFVVNEIRTDGGMGADEGALVALDTGSRVPKRNAVSDRPLLAEGDVLVHRAIEKLMLLEGGSREFIAIETVDDFDVFVVIGIASIRGNDLLDRELDPFRINLDLAEALGAFVDGVVVLLDDVHALLLVGLLGEFLHPSLGLGIRHDLRAQFEEGGLEGRIGVAAHAGFQSKLIGIDDVELRFLLGEEVLHAVRHGFDEGLIVHVGVEQEGAAFL